MANKIENREELIKNKHYPISESEKSIIASAITDFKDRIVAKYLTD
tara:strand:- start:1485 stop:1622 length:138 start_codon:yes stop_codon:yes gene_type:complete